MKEKTVDVIIPVYKPDRVLRELISRLDRQSYAVDHIMIVNVNEDRWHDDYLGDVKNVEVFHIREEEFDRGAVRDLGAGFSDADLLLFMDQYALPEDEDLVGHLVAAFDRQEVKAAYARQVLDRGRDTASEFEQQYLYPDQSRIRSFRAVRELGQGAFFLSNTCAMYDHQQYNEMGGFTRPCIAGEDELFAGRLLKLGFSIAYSSRACVRVRNYRTERDAVKNCFDRGVSAALHPEVYRELSPVDSMKEMRKTVIRRMRKRGFLLAIPPYRIRMMFRIHAMKKGLNFRNLTLKDIRKSTANSWFWDFSGTDIL
ncbi:MAG: glycosyltransferase family 2 protein [Lachnospiraceae bacterium]|nr:glycosyltransferase family 2 protein [Lachnospiraceae bacterium]